ncbi:MAG TPA: HTH domain-containing protein, partial [Kofleriaceae bacterium]|nr:HTH domain-containing protein [Kofleriaceae bacterium]
MSDEKGRIGRRASSAQLIRQWAILRMLSTSGRAFSVKELAEQFGVSKPTIERDLATLEADFAL